MSLEEEVANLFFKLNLSIAVAESCTGGLISHKLTNISGSSKYFKNGIVCYSNESKVKILKVSEEELKKFGAVSREVAETLARNVKELNETEIGLSITGIAGPTGGTDEKPVGLVYFGLSTKEGTNSFMKKFNGERLKIKEKASDFALHILKEYLQKKR